MVSGVRRMYEVNSRRARLVLGWVTVFGRVYHVTYLLTYFLKTAGREGRRERTEERGREYPQRQGEHRITL